MILEQYLKTKKISEKGLSLVDKLKQYSTDDDYIIGILLDVKSEEDKQLLLDYIDNGKDVSYESIILYALDLRLQREKKI